MGEKNMKSWLYHFEFVMPSERSTGLGLACRGGSGSGTDSGVRHPDNRGSAALGMGPPLRRQLHSDLQALAPAGLCATSLSTWPAPGLLWKEGFLVPPGWTG